MSQAGPPAAPQADSGHVLSASTPPFAAIINAANGGPFHTQFRSGNLQQKTAGCPILAKLGWVNSVDPKGPPPYPHPQALPFREPHNKPAETCQLIPPHSL